MPDRDHHLEAIQIELNHISGSLKEIKDLGQNTFNQVHALEVRVAALATWTKVYVSVGAAVLALLGWGALQIYGFNADLAAIKATLKIGP